MKPSPLKSQFLSLLFTLLSLSFHSKYAYSDNEELYYSNCAPFSCGNTTNFSYPFWGNAQPEYCGLPGFRIDCNKGSATLQILSLKYNIIEIDPDRQILRIARLDLTDNICPTGQHLNTTLDVTLFRYTSNDENATLLYNCDFSSESQVPYEFDCNVNNVRRKGYLTWPSISTSEFAIGCNVSVSIPVLERAVEGLISQAKMTVSQVLTEGFEIWWISDQVKCKECLMSNGRCGYNLTINGFSCFCHDRPYDRTCPSPLPPMDPAAIPSGENGSGTDKNIELKVGIAIGASFGGILITSVIFAIYLRRKKKGPYASSSYVSQMLTNSSDFSSRSDMEKGGSHFGVHLFTYQELETATNNFDSAKELGEGGFGTVYYGTLKDGRSVAVKRLYENNFKRVEQFMNEVDILTRLRHQNLVSLYGCTSRHSRELLLVYEYISNGTVADHLHGERAKPGELPWSTRIKIAVETANALTYLHASDIIHRDVKTNNILLDNNFVVKVADFGLSRLFPMHVTHISTAPQGTPGYVDPEYHQCYQLTDKSDVYSFGVVLIELISSMPAVDITRHRHEINLSNMAINKIQTGALDELVDKNLGYETEYDVRKMINAVAELAFQCLQSAKELRPSMEEVLLTLKEIQTKDYSLEKAEEDDAVGLLKSGPLLLSPDTVMIQWNSSSSTTPNVSG
ncbi:LEAF RUST 10 DISEASE-RESISTANCE LOCUS RECEPTOR-LIKE PROTEIN KINASE-like 1.2 isoform X1 [Mercurialis annua]|uniref:LEAF RUST 10 DISEASE-RESISTANCE LOCUS RECEPTOR-LIKE PROTEIN KINASE-like 1.2 isoform X1 n=1 Tax=Mercurialis annua TaxID=3986 RepID=UPI00215E5A23|nr:LEAF RUST 10 DISEASE-RESISTANCE LOCUS RECEPTOR-LIKE PROTEIN KINASE-like 1.2 isoform X1 [Mercurialis annua]